MPGCAPDGDHPGGLERARVRGLRRSIRPDSSIGRMARLRPGRFRSQWIASRTRDFVQPAAQLSGKGSHWVARGPMESAIEWHAGIFNEKPFRDKQDERIKVVLDPWAA
jgi:hypothetical protein